MRSISTYKSLRRPTGVTVSLLLLKCVTIIMIFLNEKNATCLLVYPLLCICLFITGSQNDEKSRFEWKSLFHEDGYRGAFRYHCCLVLVNSDKNLALNCAVCYCQQTDKHKHRNVSRNGYLLSKTVCLIFWDTMAASPSGLIFNELKWR